MACRREEGKWLSDCAACITTTGCMRRKLCGRAAHRHPVCATGLTLIPCVGGACCVAAASLQLHPHCDHVLRDMQTCKEEEEAKRDQNTVPQNRPEADSRAWQSCRRGAPSDWCTWPVNQQQQNHGSAHSCKCPDTSCCVLVLFGATSQPKLQHPINRVARPYAATADLELP